MAPSPAAGKFLRRRLLGDIRASDRLGVLLGVRLENNAYDAGARPEREEDDVEEDDDDKPAEIGIEAPDVVDRTFLGTSTSAGVRLDLDGAGALFGTATLSVRAPALEELYAFGLDAGIQAFEVGNPLLEAERSRGFDLSLERAFPNLTGSIGVFWYDIAGFTYGAASAGPQGVTVISTEQADSRHVGFEADMRLQLGSADLDARRHGWTRGSRTWASTPPGSRR